MRHVSLFIRELLSLHNSPLSRKNDLWAQSAVMRQRVADSVRWVYNQSLMPYMRQSQRDGLGFRSHANDQMSLTLQVQY